MRNRRAWNGSRAGASSAEENATRPVWGRGQAGGSYRSPIAIMARLYRATENVHTQAVDKDADRPTGCCPRSARLPTQGHRLAPRLRPSRCRNAENHNRGLSTFNHGPCAASLGSHPLCRGRQLRIYCLSLTAVPTKLLWCAGCIQLLSGVSRASAQRARRTLPGVPKKRFCRDGCPDRAGLENNGRTEP